jgi:GntR family transcriptional regulator
MHQALSKVDAVVLEIRRLIDAGDFSDGRLPSEPALARQMNASRATIRSALAQLETDGLVMRKHGSGTFVNPHVQGVQTRLEEVWDFAEMIREAGYTPDVKHCWLRIETPSSDVADHLGLGAGDEVLSTANVFLADAAPVIYVVDMIPAKLVRAAYREDELHGPVYTFLEKRCNQRVEYNIARVSAIAADPDLADLLGVDEGTPLHYFEEVGYNADHVPLMYSQEYYRPAFFDFKVIRKMTTRQQMTARQHDDRQLGGHE